MSRSMRHVISVVVTMIGAAVATGCFSGGDEQAYKIVAAQDVVVTTPDSRSVEVKKGEALPFSDKAIFVESPGHVGLMILPPLTGTGQVTANLRPIDQWGGPELEKRSNQVLGEIVDKLIVAQKMMARNQAASALTEINQLITKFPTVSYLNFIKASCLVMLNQKGEAINALEIALHDHPEHAQARNLYRNLSGKEYTEALAH